MYMYKAFVWISNSSDLSWRAEFESLLCLTQDISETSALFQSGTNFLFFKFWEKLNSHLCNSSWPYLKIMHIYFSMTDNGKCTNIPLYLYWISFSGKMKNSKELQINKRVFVCLYQCTVKHTYDEVPVKGDFVSLY